jgi:hypothetical protein
VFEEVVGLYSVKGKKKGCDIIQALLSCLQKHNLELSNLAGIFTDGASYVIGFKYGTIFLLYKHMHEFGSQNELLQYHCIMHRQHLMGKAREFNRS